MRMWEEVELFIAMLREDLKLKTETLAKIDSILNENKDEIKNPQAEVDIMMAMMEMVIKSKDIQIKYKVSGQDMATYTDIFSRKKPLN